MRRVRARSAESRRIWYQPPEPQCLHGMAPGVQFDRALKKLVRRKASGKKIEVEEPEEKPDNVIDLMEALRNSVGMRARKPKKAHLAAKPRKRKAA